MIKVRRYYNPRNKSFLFYKYEDRNGAIVDLEKRIEVFFSALKKDKSEFILLSDKELRRNGMPKRLEKVGTIKLLFRELEITDFIVRGWRSGPRKYIVTRVKTGNRYQSSMSKLYEDKKGNEYFKRFGRKVYLKNAKMVEGGLW